MASGPTATWMPSVGTHSVTIGSSMRRSLMNSKLSPPHAAQPSRGDYVAMRYNLKPPSVANATGSLVPSGEYAQKDAFQLELNAETGERHSFNVRSEPKKEVDCVLFWDPLNKILVLERLDSLLQVTHQRAASKPLPNSRDRDLHGPLSTAFPPTPPSMSPPDYPSLPDSNRPKHGETRPTRAKPDSRAKSDLPDDLTHPFSTHASAASHAAKVPPRASSEHAPEQNHRKHQEARAHLPKRSGSDFASEPDEGTPWFGKPSVPTPSSTNALLLSDVPPRQITGKRKHEDPESDPDEEDLEFGRPAREIKRPKTVSQSPASVAYGTPAMGSQNELAPSPRQSALTGANTTIPSPAYVPPKLINGSSPLATAPVQSPESDSEAEDDDDDSSGSEMEAEPPTFAPSRTSVPMAVEPSYVNAAAVDDGEEDDFLAAAFNDNDDEGGVQEDANGSDDSSDESDYEER